VPVALSGGDAFPLAVDFGMLQLVDGGGVLPVGDGFDEPAAARANGSCPGLMSVGSWSAD
jgi:hypothetical protein